VLYNSFVIPLSGIPQEDTTDSEKKKHDLHHGNVAGDRPTCNFVVGLEAWGLLSCLSLPALFVVRDLNWKR
jgi:hypothetical protein